MQRGDWIEAVADDFRLSESFSNNYKYELTYQKWNDKATSGQRFSRIVLTDYRKSMDPYTFECLMFLKVNRSKWDINLVSKLVGK